ncbi:Addiction module antitoxin (fragment) [Nitrospira japonica]|uniref:Addiction module antitoxin n=1 Tax=Nitrospira japonica TaxID=1325564 RepID=A0A1W1I8U3_9BACT
MKYESGCDGVSTYSLCYKPSVERDLHSIPHTIASRLLDRIDRLTSDPFPPQSIKLHGAERLYRLRVGDYRIVYEVDREFA